MPYDLTTRVAVLETDMKNLKASVDEEKVARQHDSENIFIKLDKNGEDLKKISRYIYIGIGGLAAFELFVKLGEWIHTK